MAHNSSLLLNNYYVTSTGKEVLLQYNALLQYILIKLRCFAKGTRRKVKNQSGKYYHYNIKQENQSPAYNNIAILIYIYILLHDTYSPLDCLVSAKCRKSVHKGRVWYFTCRLTCIIAPLHLVTWPFIRLPKKTELPRKLAIFSNLVMNMEQYIVKFSSAVALFNM